MNTQKKQFDLKLETQDTRISPRQTKKNADSQEFYYILGFFSQLGVSIAFPIAVGALFGSWVDTRFGTEPKAVLTGIGIGFVLSIMALVRTVTEFIRMQDSGKARNSKHETRNKSK